MAAGRQFPKQVRSGINKPVCVLRCQTHQTPLVPRLFLRIDVTCPVQQREKSWLLEALPPFLISWPSSYPLRLGRARPAADDNWASLQARPCSQSTCPS